MTQIDSITLSKPGLRFFVRVKPLLCALLKLIILLSLHNVQILKNLVGHMSMI
jgi:hypothetical protein